MPMALAWSFLCSLCSSLGDPLLAFLWTFLNRSGSIGGGQPNDATEWSKLGAQLLTKLVIYFTINLVCLYTKYLIDLAQRNAFLETRRSIETRAKIARENDKQERLLLSLLPRFVALEIIADIAKEDNHDKLLRNQFHKIYIHSYSNVRLVATGSTQLSLQVSGTSLKKSRSSESLVRPVKLESTGREFVQLTRRAA